MKKLSSILPHYLYIMFLAFCLITPPTQADVPEWIWAKQHGGNNFNSGKEIVTDASGNIYVTGFFQGTAQFGDYSVSSLGGFDMFLVKYNPEGEVLWATSMGGPMLVYGVSLDIDAELNVYVVGYFMGSLQTDVGTFSAGGVRDVYLAGFNAQGELQWVRTAGSPSIDQGQGIAVDDHHGRVYITGSYIGVMTFPGSGVQLSGGAGDDLFVAAYDLDGNFLWARGGIGPENNLGFELGTDAQGNIYGVGTFTANATFGSIQLQSSGDLDILTFKLDPEGNWLWARAFGGTLPETAWDISVAPNGDAWVAGIFGSLSINFDGSFIYGDGLYYSTFIVRQNASGEILWARSGGGSSHDYARGVTHDAQGNSYISGNFNLTATFGTHSITAGDNTDAFVVKYSPDGEARWAVRAGGISTDVSDAIAADRFGNVYITGYFYQNIAFGDINMNTISQQDIFVARLQDEAITTEYVSLSGRVTDSENQAIEGVMIQLSGIETNTQSDEQGHFVFEEIPANQDITLLFRHIAYFPYNLSIEIGNEDIELDDVILSYAILPPTEVSASLQEQHVMIQWQARQRDKSETAELESYTVFRMSQEDMDNPENWILLAGNVHNESHTDQGWSDLEPGIYAWAVIAVYTHDLVSVPVFSNTLEKDSDVSISGQSVSVAPLLYPNPVSDMLTISSAEHIQKIFVFNAAGQLLLSSAINEKNHTMDVSRFQSGLYIIGIQTVSGYSTHSIQFIR